MRTTLASALAAALLLPALPALADQCTEVCAGQRSECKKDCVAADKDCLKQCDVAADMCPKLCGAMLKAAGNKQKFQEDVVKIIKEKEAEDAKAAAVEAAKKKKSQPKTIEVQ